MDTNQIPNALKPQSDLICGGQPSEVQFERLAAEGYRTVINLRGDGEVGTASQPALMDSLGLKYIHLPINGAAGVHFDSARRFKTYLDNAERPVVVHCASGNRVGALFALTAALDGVRDMSEAIRHGHCYGLTGLEPHVRHLLEGYFSPE